MTPARLSVVLVTDHYRTIQRVVQHLGAQTVRGEIELVIVAPAASPLDLDATAVSGFADVRIVGLESIWPMGQARAAGVRAAGAPLVFLGETHSFPHPGFAAALIKAHLQPWDVVVPGIGNANPESPLSWASFLMDYGQWLDQLPAGEIGGGPTWNVVYKRDVLADMDASLDELLSHGDGLAVAFRAAGRRSFFEPAARLDHVNVSRPRWWVEQRYLVGLLIAGTRSARWSPLKRLKYIAASPLIPAVVLWRVLGPIRLLARQGVLPGGTIPALLVGAIVRTAGEVVGYARGAGPNAQPRMDEYELYKLKFTSLAF